MARKRRGKSGIAPDSTDSGVAGYDAGDGMNGSVMVEPASQYGSMVETADGHSALAGDSLASGSIEAAPPLDVPDHTGDEPVPGAVADDPGHEANVDVVNDDEEPPVKVRTAESPLEYFYARRAESVSIESIRELAGRDGDDEVLDLCERMAVVESGLPRFSPEQLVEIDTRLGDARARFEECERSLSGLRVLLWECISARKNEGGHSSNRVRVRSRPPGVAGNSNRLSLLTAAAMLLVETGEAMSCREIVETLERRGIWSSPNGRTPQASANASILTEIKNKGSAARFERVAPGRFAASEDFAEACRKGGVTLADYERHANAANETQADSDSSAGHGIEENHTGSDTDIGGMESQEHNLPASHDDRNSNVDME